MKLSIKNIGKINTASVEINGITVIAGENNTGKSTVGKTLFAVFNSFYNIEKKIKSERLDSIENQIFLLYRHPYMDMPRNYDPYMLAKEIIDNVKNNNNVIHSISEVITHFDETILDNIPNTEIENFYKRIAAILAISDSEIFNSVLQKKLSAEFNDQINNVYSNEASVINLEIRNEQIKIKISDNKVHDVNKRINIGTEAIYIDDPFVLDEISTIWRLNSNYADHRNHLKTKLYFNNKNQNVIEEIIANEKFNQIYNKIASICKGDVVKSKRTNFEYKIAGSDKILDIKNLSTGLKTFAILKKLLTEGCIEYNGTLILDEPEIHLHPEWQLLFAELIVLLHREFGLHILLNTHSPYFLNAIEVYAAKYSVADKCKYYLTQNNNEEVYIKDVSNSIEEIYYKLAKPLQDLENERYRYD